LALGSYIVFDSNGIDFWSILGSILIVNSLFDLFKKSEKTN
jgi:hypothetical protein